MTIYLDHMLSPNLARALDILENGRGESYRVISFQDCFGAGVKDFQWIPIIGKEDAIVITLDVGLKRNPTERQLLQDHQIGLYILRPPKNVKYHFWNIVVEIIKQWSEIKNTAQTNKKPFILYWQPSSQNKLVPYYN